MIFRKSASIAFCLLFIGVSSLAYAQTNLALTATPTKSAGGTGTYGASAINDNVIYSPWGWVSGGNNSVLDEYFALTWTNAVTIGSIKWFGVSAGSQYRITRVTLQ